MIDPTAPFNTTTATSERRHPKKVPVNRRVYRARAFEDQRSLPGGKRYVVQPDGSWRKVVSA